MPLTIDDYLEIQQLYFRFSHLLDADKAEEFARLFTPDGVFIVRGTALGVPDRVMRGAAEVAGHVYGHGDRYRERGMRHTTSELLIEPSEIGARGASYLTVVRVGDQQPPMVWRTGRTADELVKTADGWRFRSRVQTPDWLG